MKKYFIKIGTFVSIIYYLDEVNNKICYYTHHVSSIAFRYEKEGIDFDTLGKAYKDVHFIFTGELKLNKDLNYEVIVRNYLEYLISKINEGEIIIISTLEDKYNKVIQKVLLQIRSNKRINRILINYFTCLINFNEFHTVEDYNYQILYLDEILFAYVNNEMTLIYSEENIIPSLIEKYYEKYAHTNLISNFEEFFKNKVFAQKYQMRFDDKSESIIYCRDYKIKVDELMTDRSYNLSKFIDYYKDAGLTDKKLVLISNLLNDRFIDDVLDTLKTEGFEVIVADYLMYLTNFYKYMYNAALINEDGKIKLKFTLLKNKKNSKEIEQFVKRYGVSNNEIIRNDINVINDFHHLRIMTFRISKFDFKDYVKL